MNLIINQFEDDLFVRRYNTNEYFLQTISADISCGAGIARSFNKYFNVRNRIVKSFKLNQGIGGFYETYPVISMISKERYYEKPTYGNIVLCIRNLRKLIVSKNISVINMPYIGSGLDSLEWNKVLDIIKKELGDLFVIINVYKERKK